MSNLTTSFASAPSASLGPVAKGAVRGPARLSPAGEILAVSGLLLLPLIGAVLMSHGLRDHLYTFHSSDEHDYHLPIIRDFAASFPRMNLLDYNSATTPFFHVVEAMVAKLFGPSLPVLRGVNVAATFVLGLCVYALFRFVAAASAVTAAGLALTFIVSPYVFGAAFVLLTDNLALAFAVGALAFMLRGFQSDDPLGYAAAALFACLAILTRQLYLWLLPVMIIFAAVGSPHPRMMRNGLLALLLSALAVSPYAILFVSWGGANPPVFQSFRGFNPGAPPFMLACIGLYALPFLLLTLKTSTTRQLTTWVAAMLLTTGAVLILLAAPLAPVAIDSTCTAGPTCPLPTDGYLWRAAHKFPSFAGSSIAFWVLVPLGLATLALDGRRNGLRAAGVWIFVAALPLLFANRSPFQKYYDPLALIIVFIVFFMRPGVVPEVPARWVLAVFVVLSGAFFFRNVLY